MANSTLIMGETGTGKSTSLRNLSPDDTFIISVIDKPLPFKGFKNKYSVEKKNYKVTDNVASILKVIDCIDKNAPHIKNVVIDDFQFIMANEFMRKAKESGFAKFVDIGQGAWLIINRCIGSRDDLYFFILSHTETDNTGKAKFKTIGKMLDEKITIESMFTTVLHSLVINGKCCFLTQNDGVHIAKSPMGMFEKNIIENDIIYVKGKMMEYAGEEPMEAAPPPEKGYDKQLKDYTDRMVASETAEQMDQIFKEGEKLLRPSIEHYKALTGTKQACEGVFSSK